MRAGAWLPIPLLACLPVLACSDTSYMWGKDCDEEDRCLPGYACDPATGRCLWPGELDAGADAEDGGGDAGADALRDEDPGVCGETDFFDVELNGEAGIASVAPGETVEVSLGYTLTQRTDCTACATQLLFGLHAPGYWHEPVHCHDPGVLAPCPATETGSAWFEVVAPRTPGEYAVLGSRAADTGCPGAMDNYLSWVLASKVEVGRLRVREPACEPWQVYLTGVSLDGGGPEAVVAPGADVAFTADFFATQMRGCPDCLDQIVVGVGGDAQLCHDMRIIDGCPDGERGTLRGTLRAPGVPGAHPVLYGMYAHYDCDGAMQWYQDDAPGHGSTAAVLRVQ